MKKKQNCVHISNVRIEGENGVSHHIKSQFQYSYETSYSPYSDIIRTSVPKSILSGMKWCVALSASYPYVPSIRRSMDPKGTQGNLKIE